jgi:hypothetical protein
MQGEISRSYVANECPHATILSRAVLPSSLQSRSSAAQQHISLFPPPEATVSSSSAWSPAPVTTLLHQLAAPSHPCSKLGFPELALIPLLEARLPRARPPFSRQPLPSHPRRPAARGAEPRAGAAHRSSPSQRSRRPGRSSPPAACGGRGSGR